MDAPIALSHVEIIINTRTLARLQEEGFDDLTECVHENTEIRRRKIRNGSIQYLRQCLRCGDSTSTPISHAKIQGTPAFFDESLRDERRNAFARVREEERKEFWLWYNSYLESPEWKSLRRQVLERDNYNCQGCGSSATQVHHLEYSHVGEEFLFELIAICSQCHDRLHK